MGILIDPPRWPAHGTVFAHLVSDTSLEELHAFARRAALPPQAFDHDHYDVPASRYDDLVALGATPVGEMELIRALAASGLRVRKPQKSPTRAASLDLVRRSWSYLDLPTELRDQLLARWQEPHRHYHDVRHLAQVLTAIGDLACTDPVVILAAWFHDAVYDGVPGQDEEASARLAEDALTPLIGHPVPPDAAALPASGPGTGLTHEDVAGIARLVRMTATHSPSDHREATLSDADLSILGQIPGRYHVYVRDVRLDYAHLGDDAWRKGRSQVLKQLLARDPLFHTELGRDLWEARARSNLTSELQALA